MPDDSLTAFEGNVLITGASGFVGGYLIKRLVADGLDPRQVHVVTRTGRTPEFPGIRIAQGDIGDRAQVRRVIEDVAPTAVVHLAAVALPAQAQKDPDLAWRINFDAVRYIADAILTNSPSCRLIFSGSAEAYGASFNDYPGPIIESAALKPTSTYGATKAAADVLLGQMAWQGLNAVRFRAFNHTGPGQAPQYVVASFAQQIARIEAGLQTPVLRVGNLMAARDFLDVRDVVRAYSLALTANFDFARAPVFNVASGEIRTIDSILQKLLDLSQVKIAVEVDSDRLRPSEIGIAGGSAVAIADALMWSPTIDFEQVLVDTLAASRARAGENSAAQSE